MQPVIMPKLGLTMEQGTIIRWMKAEGEPIEKGEVLFEVETDKSVNEVEAPAAGKLGKILCAGGETVEVSAVIGYILEPGEAAPVNWPRPSVSTPASPAVEAPGGAEKPGKATPVAARLASDFGLDLSRIEGSGPGGAITKEDVLRFKEAGQRQEPAAPERILVSPRARKLAAEKGLPLDQVRGSGPGGRITEEDILNYLKSQDLLQLNRLQRITAERMQQSFSTAPHFYLKVEADAGELVAWHGKFSAALENRHAAHITVTDLLIVLAAKVLKKHPLLNASWVQGGIRMHQDVNIGLAVAVEEGLIVPVIKRADQKSVVEVAGERAALVDLAQNGRLGLQDLEGGTFTLSNLGMFGVDEFTAILNPPQSAILAVGQIKERGVATEGQMKVKPTVWLTLTIDHRVLDGARGARFLKDLKDALEKPEEYLTLPAN